MSKPRTSVAVRITAAIVSFLLIAVGLCSAKSSDAAWATAKTASGSFTAAKVPSVENFQCIDSKSLLGTGLLPNSVKLQWERPKGLDDVPLEYVVSWKHTGLLTTDGSAITSDLSYVYQGPKLSLVTLGVHFTVTARPIGSTWIGRPVNVDVSSIGLLIINVYLDCP